MTPTSSPVRAPPGDSAGEPWRAVFDALDDAIFVHDTLTGGIVEVNPAACQLFGWTPDELRGRTAGDISSGEPPFTQADARRWVSLATRKGPQRFEWLYRDRSGRLFWTEVSLRRAVVAGQDRVLACVRDISDRKRVDEVLRQSEERYQNAFHGAGLGMALCSPEGRFLQVNRALCDLLGIPEGELVGRSFLDVTHPEDREGSCALMHRLLTGEIPGYHLEKRYLTRGGEPRWVSLDVTLVRDGEGAPRHTVSQIQDITERKSAEEALRASEERFRKIADATSDMIHLVDGRGRIRFVNAATEHLLGYEPGALLGRPVEFLIHPEDRDRSRGERDAIARGETVGPLELRLLMADGGSLEVEVSSFRFRTEDGADSVGAILRDVSGRRAAERERAAVERELRRSQTLEAVGRLAGGVAHDFNNLLGSILGCVYVARLALRSSARGAAELDRIQALCQRGGELTRHLLSVARRRPGREELLQVGPSVDEVRQILERTLPRNILVETSVDEGLPPVRADRSLLTAALLNLALNGRDAMSGGGTLRIRAGRSRETTGEEWVDLEVADTGHGISEALRERIFDPFFSTKSAELGVGLGLSTAQASVQRWGGKLLVDSAPGEGSTFTVRLPAAPARRRRSARARPGTRPGHPLTPRAVLLVEDEEDVQRLLVAVLEDHGYRVAWARTGLEAMERLQKDPQRFGLVVLDLILPELGGDQVYRVLRGLAPEVPVLVISGREDLAGTLTPDCPFVRKPFDGEQLLAGVATALRGHP
ncbi:MAG: PAS domain S-box protein [Deferrisomatales bacterium]